RAAGASAAPPPPRGLPAVARGRAARDRPRGRPPPPRELLLRALGTADRSANGTGVLRTRRLLAECDRPG
ncbi:hypothetical protein, partial [Kribbella sp. NPDC051770]|uniref:hypothetical protein n=1 Tax=Kribbella sp. NPDC051770 TaxID=3155413 RepID=UPI00341BDF93